MQVLRSSVLGTATVIVACLAAGCGSSSHPSQSDTGATAASKSPIVIGNETPVGAQIASYPQVPAAMDAAVTAINKSGGIQGHPLKLVSCNTQASPNLEVDCARKNVDAGMVASVGSVPLLNPAGYESVLSDAGVADVGSWSQGPQAYSGSNTFPITFNNADYVACLSPATLAHARASSVAIVAVAVTASETIVQYLKQAAAALHVRVATTVSVPLTASDYSSTVAQIQDSGAREVIVILPTSSIDAFVEAAKANGASFTTCANIANPGTTWTRLGSAGSKLIVVTPFVPPSKRTSLPLLQSYNQQLSAEDASGQSAADPSVGNFTAQMLNAWLALQAFKQVADSIPGPVTRASFLAGMKKATVNFGGVMSTISFTKSESGAGGYQHVYNPLAFATTWSPDAQTFAVIPHSLIDGITYRLGGS